MLVELISYTHDPERTVAAAIKLCYSASDIGEIRKAIDDAEAARMIGKVLKLGHLSVLEHASFTFAIEGISRACSHQLVRHRIASFSQQSQRYVKMREYEAVAPPAIKANKRAAEIMARADQTIREAYDGLLTLGINAEDARYVLPNAAETKVIMTCNARSLLNLFELRLCTRAQWEIRELAEQMLKAVKAVAPNIFAEAGPTCETGGYCREGEMSCGRVASLRHPGDKDT